jgi:hypothetical protein
MSNKDIPQPLQRALICMLLDYEPLEILVLLRKLFASYLREVCEGSLPEDFEHETCIADDLFSFFEIAVQEQVKEQMNQLKKLRE